MTKSLDYLTGVLQTIAIWSEMDDKDCSWIQLTVLPVKNKYLTDDWLLKNAYLDYYHEYYDYNERTNLMLEDWKILEASLGGTSVRSLEQLIDTIISFDCRFSHEFHNEKNQFAPYNNDDRTEVYRKFLVKAINSTLGVVKRVTEYTMSPPFEVALSWHYYLIEGKDRTIFIEWTGFH